MTGKSPPRYGDVAVVGPRDASAMVLRYDGSQADYDVLAARASRTTALHRGQASHRPLSADYEEIGLAGQYQLCLDLEGWGLAMDLSDHPARPHVALVAMGSGCGARRPIEICVKTSEKPGHLVVDAKAAPTKGFPEIVVQYGFNPVTRRASFVGWTYTTNLLACPVRPFAGVPCFAMPAVDTRPLSALETVLGL